MRCVSTRRNNPTAKDFSDDLGRFAGAIHVKIGQLVGRQPLSIERAKAGFIAEKWAASHGHAARKKNLNGRIEPENLGAGGAKEFGTARLSVRATAKREDRAFLQFGGAAESGAKLVGLELAKRRLAETFEDFRNGEARGFLDAVIEIHETPGELTGKKRTDRSLTGAHEAGEAQNRKAGQRPAQKR